MLSEEEHIQIGELFTRLTVISGPIKIKKHNYHWCRCQCGNERLVMRNSLLKGKTLSCGCYSREITSKRSLKHGHSIHGKTSREYYKRSSIISRCCNKNHPAYKDYGGRGIKICDRWLESFENFLEDMGRCPEGYTIERIDNDGDYSPENCKWATVKEQNRNKRNNRWIEYKGMRKILREWTSSLFLAFDSVNKHLKKGKTFEEALKYLSKSKRSSIQTRIEATRLLEL